MSLPVDTWLTSTVDLEPVQYLVLHRMLCHQWRHGGPLPNRPRVLARMVGVSVDEVQAAMPALRDWFRETDDGGCLVNDDLESERERAMHLRDARRRGAATTNRSKAAERPAELDAERTGERTAERDGQRGVVRALSDAPVSASISISESSPDPALRESRREEREEGTSALTRADTLAGKVRKLRAAKPELSDYETARLLDTDVEQVRRSNA